MGSGQKWGQGANEFLFTLLLVNYFVLILHLWKVITRLENGDSSSPAVDSGIRPLLLSSH